MDKNKVTEMEDGKDKELMKILVSDAKPFMRKVDGFALKIEEDKEITYKDYNGQELTLKVPKGSYLVANGSDSCNPKIQTAEEFEGKNKFIDGKNKESKPKKEESNDSPKMGMDSLNDY